MPKSICVYCSSSDVVSPAFFDVASELGKAIARDGDTLVYGGGNVGLMGAVAESAHCVGGKVIGVIPEFMHERGLAYSEIDELILTADMRERKAVMEQRADAFVALPGGFGTLEEILEVLTLKQLGLHSKPLVFINTNGFYDDLVTLFEHIYVERFAKPDYRALYQFCSSVPDTISHIRDYQPPVFKAKWFDKTDGCESSAVDELAAETSSSTAVS